jgi:uncharacterized protein (TIGR02246 family)
MKYGLVIALALCSVLLISCDSGANTTTKPADTAPATVNHEADVKKLIGDLAASLSKNDVAALDKIYADDYTLVTQTGDVATKAQRLDAIKAGELKFENVTFNVEKVRSYGDMAIAIANSKGKSTNKGVTQDTNFRVTLAANKTKDGWRLVSAHLSSLPEAAKK